MKKKWKQSRRKWKILDSNLNKYSFPSKRDNARELDINPEYARFSSANTFLFGTISLVFPLPYNRHISLVRDYCIKLNFIEIKDITPLLWKINVWEFSLILSKRKTEYEIRL